MIGEDVGGVASRGDRWLLFGLLALVVLASSLTPIRNYDYWWHLKTGDLILSRHEVPRADPYSFTAAGTPWVDHEWLCQVILYAGHTLLGPAGLVALKTALVLGLCLLMAAHAGREGHGPGGGAVLAAAALVGSSFRLDVRPELATIILVPLVIHLVLRARDTGGAIPLVLVPLLVAVGSNLHAGAVLAPALLLPGAVLTWIDGRRPLFLGAAGARGALDRSFAPRLLLAALSAALAACANPYGYRIYAVPFEVRHLLASLPSPNLEWARPDLSAFPLFWLATVAAVAVVVIVPRRIVPIATPALLLGAILAAAHLRNIGLFFVLLPYGLARPARAVALACARLWARHESPRPWGVRPGFVIAAVALFCAVPLLAVLPPSITWGLGVAPGNEPRVAVDFVESEGIGKRLYNDVRFGGYLIWRRFPRARVFIDGRNEIYPVLLREVFVSLNDSRAWQAFLARLDIDAAFLRYAPALERVVRPGADGRPGDMFERAFSVNHFPKDAWALVYWDDDAMIVVRRSQENAAVIARHEYRAIQPEDWRYLYAGVVTGHEALGPILGELRRKLSEDPGCARARSLLATFGRLAQGLNTPPDRAPAGG
ncbi:MAG: hypothetical protein DMF52_12970 [Acidobacteria bacterium]|nr:MAG: hypothetical protein DMF52_12970 [Acidobacteriota bacterium]